MDNNKNVVIVNNNRYLIIEKVEYDGRTFAYLINSSDEKDTDFVELKEDRVLEIQKDFFVSNIFPLFVDKFSGE